jgi:protease I
MKALILTASGVADLEWFYPYYRFKEEGLDVDVASPDSEKIVGEHGCSLEADLSFADAQADDYDLLFLPPDRRRDQADRVRDAG